MKIDESRVYSLGTVLRKMGKVERSDIETALERQRTADGTTRLGEILIRTGNLSVSDLETALEAQRLLRSRSKHDRAIGATKLSALSTRSVMDLSISVDRETSQAALRITAGGRKV